ADDLAGDHDVTVADVAAVNLPGVRSMQRDLSRPLELVGALQEYEVVVGALPARLGFAAAQAAVKAKRHYVDLSYYSEDPAQLHGAAQAAGVAIMPDCGLAPGLSNLIAGRALAKRNPKELTEKCREGADLVVFRVQVDGEVVTMVDRARDGMSAMARSTALTCAAFARWVAAGKVQFVGVVPPEKLATDDAAYQFILDTLRVCGIV